MLHLHILCVGKLKETWLRQASAEYAKRLQSYAKLSIQEIPDEPAPETLSLSERNQLLLREGDRLQKALPARSYPIALTLDGKTYASEAFSAHLHNLGLHGHSSLSFIIGSSYGLGSNILARAKEKLSLSTMTLPHQLCRIVLLEQLYRAASIEKGTSYHK